MAITKSVFSWHREPIVQPDTTFAFLSKHHITRLYQLIPTKEPHTNILRFLKTAQAYSCEVYFLLGEPEWALDPHAIEALQVIQRLASYQSYTSGIILDIEPHTLEAFKHQPKKVMKTFVETLRILYNEAHRLGFRVIVCLPYYFDTLGFESELREIVQETADEIAIMNYYREKEILHIQTEAKMTRDAHKKLIHIYELQPPNTHGLTDRHTYFHYGLKAVYQNFEGIKQAYPYQEIECSFHELRSVMKLAEKEQR